MGATDLNFETLIQQIDAQCLAEIEEAKQKSKKKQNRILFTMWAIAAVLAIIGIIELVVFVPQGIDSVSLVVSLFSLPVILMLGSIPAYFGSKARQDQAVNDCIQNYFERTGNKELLNSHAFRMAREHADSKHLGWIGHMFMMVIPVSLVICGGSWLAGGIIRHDIGDLIAGPLALIAAIVGAVITHFTMHAKDEFKQKDMVSFLKKKFPGFTYDPEGIDMQTLDEDSLVYTGNSVSSEDYFAGTSSGINFEYYELTCKTVRPKGGDIKHFQGGVIAFKHEIEIENSVACVSKDKLLDGQGEIYNTMFAGSDKVETDNVEWNKKYDVYAQNAQDAFYVLTPHFMELLQSLEKYSQKNAYIFGFKKNKYIICIPEFDLFKSTWRPEEKQRYLEKTVADVNQILTIVEKFGKKS